MVLGWTSLTYGHDWGDDFASYLMQAISIVEGAIGSFVVHNTFTIEHSSYLIGPTAYPWGYPLILAPVYLINGLDIFAFKIPGLLLYGGFLVCLYYMMLDRFTRSQNLLLISLFAFYPVFLSSLDSIGSDIPFLFLSTLSLMMMIQEKRNVRNNIVTGIVMFCAFFVRTSGVLLLGALLINNGIQAIRYKKDKTLVKHLAINTVQTVIVFMSLWIAVRQIFPDEQATYLAQLEDLTLGLIKTNISYYFQLFYHSLGLGAYPRIVYYLLLVFFVLGLWIRGKDDLPFIVYFILLMLNLVFWPSQQGFRFIFPVYPIFLYFVMQGMLALIGTHYLRNKRFVTYSYFIFWLGVLVFYLFLSVSASYSNLINNRTRSGPFDSYSAELFDFISENTPSESIIIFFKPRVMRLMTNRDSIMTNGCDLSQLGDYIVHIHKDSTFFGERNQLSVEEISACGLEVEPVFENFRFTVFRINRY